MRRGGGGRGVRGWGAGVMRAYYSDERAGIVLYHGDCRDLLPVLTLPGGHVVATDPPYGTGGWRRLQAGAGRNPSGSLVQEQWDDGAVDWLALLSTDVVLSFWPAARTREFLAAAAVAGFPKHRALYLRKPDPKPLPGGRTRWSVEPVWVVSRDGFTLYGGDDCWEQSTPRAGQPEATGHPYQKPLPFMLWLLGKLRGRPVVDPFAGSGTTLVAAKRLGLLAVGIEEDERWCEVTARRLEREPVPLLLPDDDPLPPAQLTLTGDLTTP